MQKHRRSNSPVNQSPETKKTAKKNPRLMLDAGDGGSSALTASELNELMVRSCIPLACRKLNARVQKDSPDRKIESAPRVMTQHLTKQIGRVISTESTTTVQAGTYLYEFDARVLEHCAHHLCLDSPFYDPTMGRAERLHHCPDFMVITDYGAALGAKFAGQETFLQRLEDEALSISGEENPFIPIKDIYQTADEPIHEMPLFQTVRIDHIIVDLELVDHEMDNHGKEVRFNWFMRFWPIFGIGLKYQSPV